MKTDLSQSCGHCWIYQICWHVECSTLTASTVRISNSPTRIPSPALALFAVMLPKAHLTLLYEGKHLPCSSLRSLSSTRGCHCPALIRPSNSRLNFQLCPGLPSPSSVTFSTWRDFKSPHLCSPQSTLRFKMQLPKSHNRPGDMCGWSGKRAEGALVITTNYWKLSAWYISLILMKQRRQIWWCGFIILGMLCCPQHGSRHPWG